MGPSSAWGTQRHRRGQCVDFGVRTGSADRRGSNPGSSEPSRLGAAGTAVSRAWCTPPITHAPGSGLDSIRCLPGVLRVGGRVFTLTLDVVGHR
jgi:hypothetical protein